MNFPRHLSHPTRIKIASSLIQHEFRKLLWLSPPDYFPKIDQNLDKLFSCPELSNPRDFWNGLHGLTMGYKLKNLIYFLTAKNIRWSKKNMPLSRLHFGVELNPTTTVIATGSLPATEVIDFYQKPQNQKLKQKCLKIIQQSHHRTSPRHSQPIFVIPKKYQDKYYPTVHDGNGRLARAILEDKKSIPAFVGQYTTKVKKPQDYWIPTSFLMDLLYFVYQALDTKDEKLFKSHINTIKHIINHSSFVKTEFITRALTTRQPHRQKILQALNRS